MELINHDIFYKDNIKQITPHDSFTEKAQSHCFSLLPLRYHLTSRLGSFQELRFHTNRVYNYIYPHFTLSSSISIYISQLKCVFAFPSRMSSNIANSSNNQKPVLKFLDCSLRVSVIPLSVATIWLTVTNKEDNIIYGEVKFSNLLGLK